LTLSNRLMLTDNATDYIHL